jgi:hypothetical protein
MMAVGDAGEAETSAETRLDRLFDELHRHGIDTTPQARAAASVVLARGRAEDASVARLAHRLAVLLAADEHEQEICRRAARHTLGGASGPVTYSDAEARVERTLIGARPWARRFWWALGGIVAAVVLWVAVDTFRSPVTVEAPEPPGWRDRVEQGFDEPFALPPERFTVVERLPHPARPYVVNGLATLPLIAFGWLAYRWWRRRVLWFRRSSSRLGATLASLGADPQFGVELVGDRQLAAAGTALARGAPVATPRLDVLATVQTSARHAGALRPVFATGRGGATTYVVLIERKSGHDHMARLADMVVDRFVELGVRCERYSFHDDPRGLTSDDAEHRFTTLQELARRLRDEKLVVIGAAEGFFHPLRGDLEGWVASLRNVQAAALLSAAPFAPVGDPRRWSHAEMALLERGFTLATATRRGLLLYSDHVAAGTADPMRLEGLRPVSRRRRRVESHPAAAPEVKIPDDRTRRYLFGVLKKSFKFLFVPLRGYRAWRDDLRRSAYWREEAGRRLAATDWQHSGELYQRLLERALSWADKFFGPATSQQAFATCIVLALIYTFLGFWLAYALGAPGVLGQTSLAPPQEYPQRALIGLGVPALCIGGWLVGWALGNWWGRQYTEGWLRRRVEAGQRERRVLRAYRLRGAVWAVGWLLAVAGGTAAGAAAAGGAAAATAAAAGAAVAATLGFLSGSWRTRSREGWLAGIAALTGSAAIGSAISGGGDFLVFLVAVFVGLAGLKGVLDALSWVATRLMLGRLRRELAARATAGRRAVVIAGHTLADLALAFVSLFALAWLLAFAFEWAAQQGIFGAFDSADGSFVRGMLDAAAAAPLREGLWLLFILATTFVPTVVHLVFLTFAPLAVIALPGRRRHALVAGLEAWDTADAKARDATAHKVAAYFARGRLRVWFAAVAIVLLGPPGVFVALNQAFGGEFYATLGGSLVGVAEYGIDAAIRLTR